MKEVKRVIRIDIDPRIIEREDNADRLRSAIHKAQVEQARLEGSAEQRAALEEANYLKGWNACMAYMLDAMLEIAKGNRS